LEIKKNISLKQYNTSGIDVKAKYFIEVNSEEDILEVIRDENLRELPKLILGGGSNILFTSGFNGLVIKNNLKGIEIIREDDQHVWVKAMSGEIWHNLVMFTLEKDLSGIENLSLIPGTTGAAPMQNIGAYGVELKEVFDSLEAMDMQTGEKRVFTAPDCCFGYRESIFKKELKDKYFILSVVLRLNKIHSFNISYGAIQQTLERMQVQELTAKAVSDAVISIRRSKLPDPAILGNAGSFFKNPEISEEKFLKLKETYPDIPAYPTVPGKVKIAAGWLIEKCGWKGKRIGETGSHVQQALVLVNYGNAMGKEIKALATEIQKSVKNKFGIDIVPEVNIV
jgi:UDP-N-acetylmuramate dehydrogenase